MSTRTPKEESLEQLPPPAIGLGWREFLPDRWTVHYICLLAYTFAIVTGGRLPIGSVAVSIGLLSLAFSKPSFRTSRASMWMLATLVWAGVSYLSSDYRPAVSTALTEYLKLLLVSLLTIGAVRTPRQSRFLLAFALGWFILYPVRGALSNYLIGYTSFGRAVAGGIYSNSNDLAALTLIQLSVVLAVAATWKS